jgi:hypothetical protein
MKVLKDKGMFYFAEYSGLNGINYDVFGPAGWFCHVSLNLNADPRPHIHWLIISMLFFIEYFGLSFNPKSAL